MTHHDPTRTEQFRLPDVGEGLVEADIVSWKVAVGDRVEVNTVLVEIETAKSLVELPSPFAGVVSELLVTEGSTVAVGTPIIAVSTAEAVAAHHDPDDTGRTALLVGYGPRTTAARRRPRRTASTQPASSPELQEAFATDWAVGRPVAPAQPVSSVVPVPAQAVSGSSLPDVGTVETSALARPRRVLSKPPVRRLARDLGVDLANCRASGPGGSVTRDDVLAVAASRASADGPPVGAAAGDERIPVRGVRRATAEAMVRSAFTAPHVTEFVTVDVTRTVKLVRALTHDVAYEGVRVSPLLLVAKALLVAVRRNPGINATWDDGAQEVVVKRDVNLGIAAATPRGLLVPNIKAAQLLSLRQLAEALVETTATARAGRTTPADMAGGTITITNVGVFGIDSGTPILNPGEAAILCLGAVRRQPWVHKGKVVPRWTTQLAVSFDHRLVDGELGSRFLGDVAAVLRDPVRALAWS